MSPAMTFISAGQTIQKMCTQMERVENVMAYPEYLNILENKKSETKLKKLKGSVENKNISFCYLKLSGPVTKNFSMSIRQSGQAVFVCESDYRKSTLSNLISGFYEPWGSEILFDGKSRSKLLVMRRFMTI